MEPVARGSSGQVWHAFDERLRRPVAVKLLNADLAAPDRDRAYREAQALASLSHAHVAAVYDCGIADDRPYLVLELIDGRSLAEVLATRGRLPWELSVACCAQVAAGLAAAHGRGVVHRDVTAANVMLTPAGVKLIDFGISAVEGEPEVDPDGGLRGTPAYAAPERLNDATVAASGDVYSLGVLLYRALSGGLPWQATTPQQLLALQHSTEPAPLPQIEGLPGRIADVCMRCLDTDPGERPTAAQLAADLADATGTPAFAELAALGVHSAGVPTLTHLLPRGASGTRTTRRRRPRTRLVTLVAGVLAAATVAWWATYLAP
ncbi:MAG: serine/threonine protein kinase, partial [Hamadaea sp.]|nr:serine/threonine protein kinase [Hamadaea sp.]